MKKLFASFALLMLSLVAYNASAQTTLFPYPTAPDTCTTLESRCNYSVTHFWDKFEYTKQLKSEQDSLLIDSFINYIAIMRQANVNVGLGSIRTLMNKAQANQLNFMKLLQCAELLLYKSSVQLIDDVYLTFAQSAVDASWIKKDMKQHYADQVKQINASKLGQEITNFQVTTANGAKTKINEVPVDTAEFILLFFSGDDTESSIAQLRLSTDVAVNQLTQQGYSKIINVYTGDNSSAFFAQASQYPNWTLVVAPGIQKSIDLRFIPNFIVLDNKHRVMNKNVTVDDIKRAFNGEN